MAEISRKEEIQQFRSMTTEEDFKRIKEKITGGELSISIGRDKSRSLLKRTQAKYYYSLLFLAIGLAVLTIYMVYLNQKYLAGFGFATTLMVFIFFWRSMTRRMCAWCMEEKRNFDYAYFTNVITVKAGENEYNYPEEHWKEALEE
jgi:Flp pilus assembly protein TadB